MTTTKKLKQIAFSVLMLLLSFTLMFVAFPQSKVFAEDRVAFSEVTITNGDFNSSTTTALQSSPTGWTRSGTSSGKNGVISVNSDSFSSRASSSYALQSSQNPYKAYSSLDDHILMINAKSSTTTNEANHIGYVSNSISLSSYSYYKFSIWTLTQENAAGSIYLNGLGDDVENTYFESYTSTVWTEYRFYIATGIDSKSVTIELWLGSSTKDSLNAVFFDHITALQLSGSYFASEANASSRTNVIDLREFSDNVIENPDFELGNFTGWQIVNPLTQGDAKIVSINYAESMTSLGLDYLGSSLSENNHYALAIYSNDKEASIGYESQSFLVKPYETYKITVWAKVSSDISSKASIVLKEGNDVKNFYGEEDNDFYSPVTLSLDVTTNTSNSLTNDYTPYYFFVKGHELYSTSFTLQLWLGSSEESATGCVVFDDIKFEKISWEQFNNASTSNTQTATLTTIEGTPSVENGTFNVASNLKKDFEYPVTPNNWTYATKNTNAVYGIVNTYSPLYEANKSRFGNIQNPGNPTLANVNNEVNNVLLMYNPTENYQSITSATLSTTLDSYQKITFDYKTIAQSLNTKLLNVYVLDSDNNVLYVDEGIYSENWSKYTILIKSYGYSTSIKLMLSLGNEDEQVTGYLFVDNVKFETDSTMTDDLYNAYVDTHKTLDFSVTNFNLISPNQTNNMYTPYRYTAELANGTNGQGNPIAYGGIIDGDDNIFGITNSQTNSGLKYMPAFVSNGLATYYLTAKDTLSLESSNYYKFSVDVYTRFTGDFSPLSEDEEAKYGAVFAIQGLEEQFDNIVSNDQWTTYTIYAKVNSTTSVNLKFGITSNSNAIQGQVFFDNFKYEKIEELEYTQATNLAKTDNTMLVSGEVVEEEDDNKDSNNANETNNAMIWYLIPTGLLFIALVIALMAYFGKKITIKKWERKKVAEYDRDATLHRDVIRRDAEKIRDEKVKEIKKQIEELKTELERIEEIHKENVKSQRTTADRSITREAERDFKAYAQKHTKLENQIELLNNKIDSLNMPEYLLSIQRNLILEKVRKEREEKDRVNKQKKQEQKQAKLASKKNK